MNFTTSNDLDKRQDEDSKKHNTAITSIQAFRVVSESGQRLQEKQIVLEKIRAHQPITSRSLSKITGIERTNITRSLFDLLHNSPPLIKEAKIDKCPVTKRKVKYYSLPQWPQTELFKT